MSCTRLLRLATISIAALLLAACASSGAGASEQRPKDEPQQAAEASENPEQADTPSDSGENPENSENAENADEMLVRLEPGRIAVGGEVIVELESGDVPGNAKQGGTAGYLIQPLYDHLVTLLMEHEKDMLRQTGQAGKPPVRISAAPGLDFRVLTEAFYTIAQTGVTHYRVDLSRGDYQLPAIDTTKLTGAKPTKPEANIAINIGADGFLVVQGGEPMDAREACPSDRPTFCLTDKNRADLEKLAADAKSAELEGNATAADEMLSEMADAYDFRRLYNTLVELEAEAGDGATLYISAEEEIPVGLFARVMSLASRRLPESSYEDREAFRAALAADERAGTLFDDIRLAVAPPSDSVPFE